MSELSDEPDPETYIDNVDGEPHVFVIRDEMTQTTPVLHEEVIVDLGPLKS